MKILFKKLQESYCIDILQVFYDPVDEVVVEDCCPRFVYNTFPFCNGDAESPFWQVWSKHRLIGLR